MWMSAPRRVGAPLRWPAAALAILAGGVCASQSPAEPGRSPHRRRASAAPIAVAGFRLGDKEGKPALNAGALSARFQSFFAPTSLPRTTAAAKPKPYFGLRWDPAEPARTPDCSVANGPLHILQTVNSRLTVLNAQGRIVLDDGAGNNFRRLRDLFSSIPDTEDVEWFGPRCLFDAATGRFFVAAAGADFADQDEAWLAIAVSAGPDPLLGEWTVYGYRTDVDGGNPVSCWADALDIGLDGTYLAATWNDHAFGANAFVHSRLWSFSKAGLVDGSETTHGEISDLRDSASVPAFAVKPCRNYGGNDAFYLVSSNPLGGASLELWRLTGDPQSPGLTSVTVSGITDFEVPPNARQPGVATGSARDALEPGDCRIQSAVAENNRIWTGLNSSLDGVVPDAAILVAELDGQTGTAVQSRSIGSRGTDYYFPALDTTTGRKPGTVIVFSSSSKKQGVGLRYCTRLHSMPPGQFRMSKALIAGNGRYDPLAPRDPLDPQPRPLWGRHCSAVRNLANPEQVLVAGPYADANKSRSAKAWATRLKHVTP